MLAGLKERARVAAESTQLLETTVADRGLEIDTSAKKAIQEGGNMTRQKRRLSCIVRPARRSRTLRLLMLVTSDC
jgi:hypothetical protein